MPRPEKKSEAANSDKKVLVVDRLLTAIFEILDDEPTRAYWDLLGTEVLPQNSDVVLMLGQTKGAMTSFSSRYDSCTSKGGAGWKTAPKKGD